MTSCELCRATTTDGLQLAGVLTVPAEAGSTALLLIHGAGSNFYSGGVLATIAEQAAAVGFPVLRINTRGHDLAASIPGPKGPVQGGAAFERVLDCRLDVTAWCDFLQQRGHARIVLIGHSLGGVKAFWSQQLAPHPAVSHVVGVSPPRFRHQKFQTDERCEPFRRDFAAASQCIAAGRPDTLMSVTQPLPLLITAAGFVEKYGPDDGLDYVPILPQLSRPKLILLGGQSVETNAAFADLPTELSRIAAGESQFAFELIAGADINYRNDPEEPWRRIRHWHSA
jgi:pimeloyl-ACP methyl ester carboxylesterase